MHRQLEEGLIDLLNAVCEYYKIDPAIAITRTSKREVVLCRQMTWVTFLDTIPKRWATLAEIGNAIGEKDHATVLHGKTTIKDQCDVDIIIRSQYNEILSIAQKVLAPVIDRINLSAVKKDKNINLDSSKYLVSERSFKIRERSRNIQRIIKLNNILSYGRTYSKNEI